MFIHFVGVAIIIVDRMIVINFGRIFFCFIYCFVSFMFFFFKQKTAYEMRISDWSSDVCSSDLLAAAYLVARKRGYPAGTFPGWGIVLRSLVAAKIGRASCRERVCQYV